MSNHTVTDDGLMTGCAAVTARAATVARVVQAAVGTTPSLAAARRALQQWAGHPADPAMKDDALAMLSRIEQEAMRRAL